MKKALIFALGLLLSTSLLSCVPYGAAQVSVGTGGYYGPRPYAYRPYYRPYYYRPAPPVYRAPRYYAPRPPRYYGPQRRNGFRRW